MDERGDLESIDAFPHAGLHAGPGVRHVDPPAGVCNLPHLVRMG
jgi:hypothetical protein